MPTRTNDEVEQKVLDARARHRDGLDVLGPKIGVPPTGCPGSCAVYVPYLRECDPMTGEVVRSSKQTAVRRDAEELTSSRTLE